MRCKHLTGDLIEFMDATHTRQVRDGIMEEIGYNEVENITGYEYRCFGCKKSWRSKTLDGFKPKWLKAITDQF